jgi:hypothetical protein
MDRPDSEYERALQSWRSRRPGSGHAPRSKPGFIKKGPDHSQALGRVRDWTRERFKLPDETVILVTEVACALPGCPPLETVVAFWTAEDRRHHFKLFKPVAEVALDDLPPSWMRDALIVDEQFGCECC